MQCRSITETGEVEYIVSVITMTEPMTVVTKPEEPERPEKPEESDTHGSDYFDISDTYDAQTAMVRSTLWPTVTEAEVWSKTYFSLDNLWPDPPECLQKQKVGTMLDDIDCTNDVKSNITTTSKIIDHDNRLS